jgi:trimeric autotransporter adhesin
MRFRAALVGALLVVVSSGLAFGQGFQGGLRGSVKDSGGVVPGAEVTLTNDQTNIKRSTVTNERGEYVFANVDPGNFSVKVTLQGYKTIDRGDIRIGTQQFLTLDLTMEVGAITESVTVTGQSPLIETSNASTGTVLDSAALQALPSPGRNAFMIGSSVPTVVPSGDAQFNRQQDQTNSSLMSLGGGTRRGNNYTLDGVPITDMRNRMSAVPTTEGVEDLKVQVHTYDAEMGRTGGGVFNLTAKSGTNNYHGTGFFQTRPIWGQTNNYFSQIASDVAAARGDTVVATRNAKPNSPYYLGGGGFGGPIVKDRTFFWFSSENYHDVQTRNSAARMPTQAERNGDFSGLLNTSGQQVIIYDPLTKLPFPGNVIPAGRINPVAAAMIKYLPLPDVNVDNGSNNYNRTSLINNKFESEIALKAEHKFTDKVSLTGFYLYNRTDEPCQNYFGTADQTEPNRFADPLDYILKRRPQLLALNNTWVLSDSSVMSLRFGMTRFPDNNTLSIDFDPKTLGFNQNYTNLITKPKFPQVDLVNYDALAGRTLGAINPTEINWKSTSANAAYSRFFGTHTVKIGGDYRKIAMDSFLPGDSSGLFRFDNEFTSANNSNSNATSGNSVASFLLGYPSANSGNPSQFSISTPLNVFTNYFGGYAQDDWRASSKLTVNYGLRLEHETGLAEQNNNFTVGFDPTLTSALSTTMIPADPVAGTGARPVVGGLMYAGVNGNKTTQGNPPKIKASPRVGVVYSINASTVLRSGYGIYWAPFNYQAPSTSASNYGQVGFTQNTFIQQTAGTPTITLDNPFPTGVLQPSGNSKGALSGVGGEASFVDQNRSAPRVQQWSADLQRELGAGMALTFTYMGARGDHLALGGSNEVPVNLNQLDPKYLALGATALGAQLPNPFFGNPNVPAVLSTPATLTRARLLMPYPQFTNVYARQVTEGLNRYNAGIIEWTKRPGHGWGGRASYTYSVLKDNQLGETNFYSALAGTPAPLNAYNYNTSAPACAAGAQFTTACYDPRSEYGYGILDVPHRIIVAPMVELPFGKGKKFASNSGLADAIVGGWSITSITTWQAGFPLNVVQSNPNSILGGTTGARPNINSGVDLATPGDYLDRLASADHPTATWINPAAFSLAAAGTFGNTPRTITDLRTPTQFNTDVSFMKNFRLGGSKAAQVKLEVLNLFNRPTVRALQGNNTFAPGNSFGQTTLQSGFMRIMQFMFRVSF